MTRPPADAAARWRGYQRVREARDPAAAPARLAELARDPLRPVRLAVARHPAAPAGAVALLLGDVDPTVASTALHLRDAPAEALSCRAAVAEPDERWQDRLRVLVTPRRAWPPCAQHGASGARRA